MKNTTVNRELFFEYDIFSVLSKEQLFQQFKSEFFKSTLKISAKVKILYQFFEIENEEELKVLIAYLKNNYDVRKLKIRNEEMSKFLTSKE